MANWISRNEAAAKIGLAVYGRPRSLSLPKLVELIKRGKIEEMTFPSLGGRLSRHQINEESVDRFIREELGVYGSESKSESKSESGTAQKSPAGVI